ncbi:MAG TPA: hypothetical protein PLQ93_04615 [Bacteroidia bacterium]|nr:hypothetical protein [Bacteroidia bacterium]
MKSVFALTQIILSSLLFFSSARMEAQDSLLKATGYKAHKAWSPARDTAVVRNKKGRAILPQKGDVALGFNMIPVLDLVFSSFHFNQPYPGADSLVQYTQNANNQVVGKFYLDASTAIRLRFGVNTLSGSISNRVQDAEAMYQAGFGTPDDIAAASLIKVQDKVQFTKNNILFALGIEKRRGYRRLQGFYGAEIGIGHAGSSEVFTYGNPFSDLYPVDYTDNFNTLHTAVQSPTTSTRVERSLESKNAGGWRYGIRGFAGIEYFIFPKISLGVEYGWGFAFLTSRGTSLKREVYFNGQNGPTRVIETVENTGPSRQMGFSVDNNNGTLFSMNNTLGGNTILSGGAGALTLLFHF